MSGQTKPGADTYAFGGTPLICTQTVFALKSGKADSEGNFTLTFPLGGIFVDDESCAGEPLATLTADEGGGWAVIAPAAPTLLDTFPASPADNQSPYVRGEAEEGTNITISNAISYTEVDP